MLYDETKYSSAQERWQYKANLHLASAFHPHPPRDEGECVAGIDSAIAGCLGETLRRVHCLQCDDRWRPNCKGNLVFLRD